MFSGHQVSASGRTRCVEEYEVGGLILKKISGRLRNSIGTIHGPYIRASSIFWAVRLCADGRLAGNRS